MAEDWADKILREHNPPGNNPDWADEVLYGFATTAPTEPPPVSSKGSTQSLTIEDPTFMDRMETFGRGLRTGVPIVGEQLQNMHTGIRSRFRSIHSGETPEAERAQIESQGRAQDLTFPGTKVAGEITGGVVATAPLVAVAPGAFGLANASRLENAARAGITSGLLSGADASARGQDATTSALIGGTVAAAVVPFFARVGGRVTAPRSSTAPTTTNEASAAASRFYQEADDLGVRLAPSAFRDAATAMRTRATADNIDEVLHPSAARLLAIHESRAAAGQAMTFREIENVRRQATTIMRRPSVSDDEQRIIRGMVSELDDKMASLTPQHVLSGDPKLAVAATTQARSMWRKAAISERVDEALDRATRHASGFANGVRAEFRKLANERQFMRGLADDERAAVKQMSSARNYRSILNIVARMDPARSRLSAGVGVGGAILGSPGTLALPAAGRIATLTQDRGVTRRVERFQRGVLRGSQSKPVGKAGGTLGAAFGVELSKAVGQ